MHFQRTVGKTRHRKNSTGLLWLVEEVRILHDRLKMEGHPEFATYELKKKHWQAFMYDRGYAEVTRFTSAMLPDIAEYIVTLHTEIWKWRIAFDFLADGLSAHDLARVTSK